MKPVGGEIVKKSASSYEIRFFWFMHLIVFTTQKELKSPKYSFTVSKLLYILYSMPNNGLT